jgi:uncharacterized protein (TIGR02391 family)
MSFYQRIQNEEDVLALEPEELAGPLLIWLNSLWGSKVFGRRNVLSEHSVAGYGQAHQRPILRAMMEAWTWLEREGFIVEASAMESGTDGWYFISRRGQQITHTSQLVDYRRANILPRNFLHPIISEKVYPTFLRGRYDTAVFEAFKEVEVRVREAGGFTASDHGTDLMRKAFHKDSGPLTDKNAEVAEREALAHLFAGAYGAYRNPHSHRNVELEAHEAAETIILASHLMSIVDARDPNSVETEE